MKDIITGSLQENVMTLLCFDKESVALLATTLDVELFESSISRDIVRAAINYYGTYKEPIGEHLADVLEEQLNGKQKKLYNQLLNNIYAISQSINKTYVLDQLKKFVGDQTFKVSLKQAAELVVKGKVEEAKKVLDRNKDIQISMFDPGTCLWDVDKFMEFTEVLRERIKIGIPELDAIDANLARKEMLILMSLANVGKTFSLIHVGRNCLMQKLKVLHVTLEMAEPNVSLRYVQNFFAISKKKKEVEIPYFVFDEKGMFQELKSKIKNEKTLKDKNIESYIKTKLEKMRYKNLVIKEFPEGTLTIKKFKAYLENLINYTGFIPDVVLWDYPDLMKYNSREELKQVFTGIRGLAKEYNHAACCVTQSNRDGVSKRWIDEWNFSEDFSKFATADVSITLNQNKYEYLLKLARLLIIKNRGYIKGQKVCITQNLGISQFCLDSYLMNTDTKEPYWNVVEDDVAVGKNENKSGKTRRKTQTRVRERGYKKP